MEDLPDDPEGGRGGKTLIEIRRRQAEGGIGSEAGEIAGGIDVQREDAACALGPDTLPGTTVASP